MKWLLKNSLWLIGLGLMLASSGIDGAYLTRIMPEGFFWLGLVLNTTADVSGMVLTYYYGLLRRTAQKGSRKYKMANVLLSAEAFAVLYSWFFSWRQLRIVMQPIEGEDTAWIALVSAAFVPGLLAFIGFTESLLAENETSESAPKVARNPMQVAQPEAKLAPQETKVAEVSPKVALQSFEHNEVSRKLLDIFGGNPYETYTQAAKVAQVSRTTVANYLKAMETAGVIKSNGNGVEIL